MENFNSAENNIGGCDRGDLEDGKRLSGYQKIRVQVIRTAAYQVKEQ